MLRAGSRYHGMGGIVTTSQALAAILTCNTTLATPPVVTASRSALASRTHVSIKFDGQVVLYVDHPEGQAPQPTEPKGIGDHGVLVRIGGFEVPFAAALLLLNDLLRLCSPLPSAVVTALLCAGPLAAACRSPLMLLNWHFACAAASLHRSSRRTAAHRRGSCATRGRHYRPLTGDGGLLSPPGSLGQRAQLPPAPLLKSSRLLDEGALARQTQTAWKQYVLTGDPVHRRGVGLRAAVKSLGGFP